MLSTLGPVTNRTRLLPVSALQHAERAAAIALQSCSRSEAAQLTAELLACYPDMLQARRTPEENAQFQAYSVKLFEAFEQFSFAIGKAIVHAGTGLPAKLPYKPKPSDILAIGLKERERFETILTMAKRQQAESQRRADEDSEPDVTPEARARITAGLKALSTRLQTIPDPAPLRSPGRLYGATEPLSGIDVDALIASHDAGLAESATRRQAKSKAA